MLARESCRYSELTLSHTTMSRLACEQWLRSVVMIACTACTPRSTLGAPSMHCSSTVFHTLYLLIMSLSPRTAPIGAQPYCSESTLRIDLSMAKTLLPSSSCKPVNFCVSVAVLRNELTFSSVTFVRSVPAPIDRLHRASFCFVRNSSTCRSAAIVLPLERNSLSS